jgi:hypothetical protein
MAVSRVAITRVLLVFWGVSGVTWIYRMLWAILHAIPVDSVVILEVGTNSGASAGQWQRRRSHRAPVRFVR